MSPTAHHTAQSGRVARRGRRQTAPLLAALLVFGAISTSSVTALAGGTPQKADPALVGALQGNALQDGALGKARGGDILLQTAKTTGSVAGNTGSSFGVIADSHSVNANSGITSVFQNTGNNALIQNTMNINISIK